MRKRFGLILASGPSNAAVDELAERIVLKDGELCDRYNQSLSHGETHIRRALVLRGYQANDEVNGFNGHLKDPTGATTPKRDYGDDPPWKLVNPMTFWTLVCLKSKATESIRKLHPDDLEALHDFQGELESCTYDSLRAMATGEISWEKYANSDPVGGDALKRLWQTYLVQRADFLCVTPALLSGKGAYAKFKKELAQGVVIDEAGEIR